MCASLIQDKAMKEDEAPLTLTTEVTAYEEIQHKRRRLEQPTTNSSDQLQTESSDHTISVFPLQYIVDEHVIQALHDVSDDNIHLKIWLTYCKDPALKSTLHTIYHDHGYSDIPKLECTDTAGIPEPSYNEYVDIICNTDLLYDMVTEHSPPSHPVESSDVTECNIMDSDTDNPSECVDIDRPLSPYDMINESLISVCRRAPSDETESYMMDDKFIENLYYKDRRLLQGFNMRQNKPHSEFKSANIESKVRPSNTDMYGKFENLLIYVS